MNMLEGESSGLSTQPAKRRRGRPRKDASLKQAEAAQTPASEGRRANPSQRANRTRGTECMVGQAVNGFIEATFSSGYLLNVRIANSNTNLRGVVFKPGHCAPITAENDIAPDVEMIRRTKIRFTARNQGQSQKQTAAGVPEKRKRAPAKRKRAPVPPVTTVATVAPQPATYPRGLQTCDNKDLEVQMVEPLSMLPPGRAIPVGQVFVPAQPYLSWQAGSEQYGDGSLSKGTSEVGQDETHKPKTAADIVMQHHIDTQGTSQVSDTVIEEYLKSSPDNSGFLSEYEIGNTFEPFPTESSHIEPLINFGSGSMTELLKAFQENSKERQLLLTGPPPAAEVDEATTRDSVPGTIP